MIPISEEMVAAGSEIYIKWFGLDRHSEGMVELPADWSIAELVQDVFAAMASRSRKSRTI
jgi:hypothetical protein